MLNFNRLIDTYINKKYPANIVNTLTLPGIL